MIVDNQSEYASVVPDENLTVAIVVEDAPPVPRTGLWDVARPTPTLYPDSIHASVQPKTGPSIDLTRYVSLSPMYACSTYYCKVICTLVLFV